MKTYENKFNELVAKANAEICKLVLKKGKESSFMSGEKSVDISELDIYALQNFMVEVHADYLYSDLGYQYDLVCLDPVDLFRIVDYLKKKK